MASLASCEAGQGPAVIDQAVSQHVRAVAFPGVVSMKETPKVSINITYSVRALGEIDRQNKASYISDVSTTGDNTRTADTCDILGQFKRTIEVGGDKMKYRYSCNKGERYNSAL